MEKASFACLLNIIFYEENPSKKLKKISQNIMRSLLRRMAWFTEFRCGRIRTSDAERPGRPKEVTS